MRFFRKLRNAIGKQGSQPNHTRQRVTSSRLRPLRCEPLEDRRMLSITLFVDGDAAPGGNGLTWDTAYNDLQDALMQATVLNGDTDEANDIEAIWIAEGTYYPSDRLQQNNNRFDTFELVDGVTLYGGFAGNETTLKVRDFSAHTTTLSGNIGNIESMYDNAYTVVYCGENIVATLDGFVITEGNADSRNGDGLSYTRCGGGVFNYFGDLTLRNSTIQGNYAISSGGGVYNCVYEHSYPNASGLANLTIENCIISGNSADYSGGAICNNGTNGTGGIATTTITNSIISGNTSIRGGGIANRANVGVSTLIIVNSTISGNSATGTDYNATAYGSGGGIYNNGIGASAKLYNTIVAQNTTLTEGLDIYADVWSSFSGSNNLIGDGTDQSLVNGVNGNRVGTSSSPINPQFTRNPNDGGDGWGDDRDTYYVDESLNDNYGDLRLKANSPAIDTGDSSLAVDSSGATILYDLAGTSRIHHEAVDMGAYEYHSCINVSIGNPSTINEGDFLPLTASASTNPGSKIVSYYWDFDDDSQYNDAVGDSVILSAENSGSYIIRVKVTDDAGQVGFGSVEITVTNIAPIADIGGPYVINEGKSATLDASGSIDPGNDIVLYEWDLDNDGQYDDAAGVTVGFSNTEDGSYTVGLRVTDDDGASSVDSVTVTVNNVAPTADAGGPYVVDENKEITLDASGSTDPGDDIVSYEWDLDGDGQYDDATGVTVDFSRAASGNYTVWLKVTDDDGGVGLDSVAITVNDIVPTADTEGPYTINEGDTVTLDASGSTDPDYAIVSYEWDLDNDGQYDDASGATASFSQIVSGSHTVRVKVTAADDDWDVASTTVTVNPIDPEALLDVNPVVGTNDVTFSVTYSDNIAISTATIGYGDVRVTGPNGYDRYATLLGVDDSTDGSPRTATYRTASPDSQWTKYSNGTYRIVMNADQVSDTAGNFVVSGRLGSFNIDIPNLLPVADAGGPYVANEGENITLDASGSNDLDGNIVTYAWDFDGDGEYDDATGLIVNFTPTASGNFTIGLQVTDDEGAAGTDSVVVTINKIPPTANAGGPYGTREGLPVTLDASGSTAPGNDIVSYAWDFDGDGEYDDAFGVTVDFSPKHSGDQTVSVKVTDDDGDFDTADAQIAVRNIKPTANAGGPYTCTEGDALTLDASASADPGNDIVSYEWDFNSDAVYDDAEGAVVQFPTSTAGTFVAAVKVTDDDGTSSTALALVIIQEKPVQDWGTVRLNLRDLADTKDIEWLDEWSDCWIEVWVTGTANNAIDSFDVELAFEADCFTPELAMVQPGEKVNAETLNAILNESTGNLQITGTTLTDNAGQGSEVLLAKLTFRPTPGESVLPRDTDGKYLEPVADAGFHAVQAGLTSPNSSTISTPTIAPQDDTPLWPVMYDLDGNSVIDLLDVAQMLAVFQWTTDDNATPMTWASDFDRSGAVDLLDVAEMLARFQYRKGNGNSVTYPAAFPFDTTESSTAASVGKTTVPRQKPLPSCRFIPPTPEINEVVLAKYTWNKFNVTAIAKDLIPVSTKKSILARDALFSLEIDPYSAPE